MFEYIEWAMPQDWRNIENSKIHVVNKAYKGNAMVTKDNQIKRNTELHQLHMYNPQQKCWEG